jgi:hypothetical protein
MTRWAVLVGALTIGIALWAQREFVSLSPPVGSAPGPVVSNSLSDWEQKDWATDPARNMGLGDKINHPIKCNDTEGWTADNNLAPTVANTPAPKTPPAPALHDRSLKEEGPYLKTKKEDWKIFEMTIEYRPLDDKQVPPLPAKDCTTLDPRPANNQHWSNSGVYIFDRYEVQIIDPSKFSGNKTDQPVQNADGVSNRNQLLPGGLYELDPPGGQFINRAKTTGQWNTLIIKFCAPLPDGTPAKIQTALNPAANSPNVVWQGQIRNAAGTTLPGTGGRMKAKLPFAYQGPIFLQSHWGSQVQFRKPVIKELAACPL